MEATEKIDRKEEIQGINEIFRGRYVSWKKQIGGTNLKEEYLKKRKKKLKEENYSKQKLRLRVKWVKEWDDNSSLFIGI